MSILFNTIIILITYCFHIIYGSLNFNCNAQKVSEGAKTEAIPRKHVRPRDTVICINMIFTFTNTFTQSVYLHAHDSYRHA